MKRISIILAMLLLANPFIDGAIHSSSGGNLALVRWDENGVFAAMRIFLAENYGDPAHPENIIPETTFVVDLEMNELDMVEFISFIDEEFNVDVPDDEWVQWETVGDAYEYVNPRYF